ncbi:hypothetical protein NKH77_06750 [Streptomyces sp. M19]
MTPSAPQVLPAAPTGGRCVVRPTWPGRPGPRRGAAAERLRVGPHPASHAPASHTPASRAPRTVPPRTAPPPAPQADRQGRPAPLTRIADAIGCAATVTVTVTTDAAELRQGACRTRTGEFRMVTFATGDGRRDWLAEARAYGGTYLVGDRWIVTAQKADALTALRGTLGGTVESGDSHGGTDAHHGM